MNPNKKIAAIDIGNSRIKLLFDRDIQFFPNIDNGYNAFKIFINSLQIKPDCFGISSVDSKRKFEIIEILEEFDKIEIIELDSVLSKQTIIDFSEIKGIGSDRALGLIGALQYFNSPLITIDCGTAVTINAVNENNICVGGVIFAGVETQMKALYEKTAVLPNVNLNFEYKVAGKNTQHAIRSGIIYSIAGGIKEIVAKISVHEFHDKKAFIIITGGSSELILPALKDWNQIIIHKPNLVCEGIIELIKSQL